MQLILENTWLLNASQKEEQIYWVDYGAHDPMITLKLGINS